MTQHTFDVARARRETPSCGHRLHFNNAGASLMPATVLDTLTTHLRLEAEIGGYEAEDAAAEGLEGLYDSLARLINARRDEIAVLENATRAWDMAFYALTFEAGDRILTTQSEYASNVIAFLHIAKKKGVILEIIPDDPSGQVSSDALRRMIDRRVKLIAMSHVPTQGGLVNPAQAVGAIARANAIPFLLDACQSVGQMPIDVEAMGCDMLSATGRKFLRGPRGTGFLYIRRAWIERLDPPFLDGRAATWTAHDTYQVRPDARRFENWESYVAGRLGLRAAVDYALGWGLDAISVRVNALADRLRSGLSALSGVSVHDRGVQRCAIVTFTKAGLSADVIKEFLKSKRMNVSVSTRQWALFDFDARGLTALVRASPHYFNTEDEVDAFVRAVDELE